MSKGLEASHGETGASFKLAPWRRLNAGSNNLATIGPEIDDHGDIGGLQFAELQAQRWEAEEDEEKLDQEWRVADQLDIGCDHRL
ncbi:hypothetical protein D9M68_779930 [compost metagenome]